MTRSTATARGPAVSDLFGDSVPGLYLGPAADAVFALGTVSLLPPGAIVPAAPRLLHVVLEGRIAGPQGWYGPGNHVAGEEGLTAVDLSARLWTLDLSAPSWTDVSRQPLRRALAKALIAADRAEAAAQAPAILPDPTTLCDIDHPEIRRRAARLRRATPASTAEAILKYVCAFPYRFGNWQERASDTMARGVGMCTTKANLQVALMRASGLEAGFVETPMTTAVLGQLMPDAWLALQRPVVKHYFAAVKLGGRWHAADASYDDAAYAIYLQSMPHVAPQRVPFLAEGRPYSPAYLAKRADPWEITVVPDLNEVMGKTSRFKPRHFEALNTRMDRARGVGPAGIDLMPAARDEGDEVRA